MSDEEVLYIDIAFCCQHCKRKLIDRVIGYGMFSDVTIVPPEGWECSTDTHWDLLCQDCIKRNKQNLDDDNLEDDE